MKKKLSKEEKRERKKQKVAYYKMILDKFLNHNKKEKVEKPKSYKARKVGIFAMWGVVLLPTLILLANNGGGQSEAKEVKSPIVQKKENPATSQVAVQFAKDFTQKYFYWSSGDKGKEVREKDLKPFLAKGLDPFAGLDMDNLKSDSSFREATLKNVEETGKDKARISLVAKYEVTPAGDQGDDKSPVKKKTSTKVIVVPVEYNGKTYGVYELPTFASLDNMTNVKVKDDNTLEKLSNSQEVHNISNFLNTFFSSYTQDTKDKLSYILTDKKHQNGLQNSMKFVEVTDSETFLGQKKNEYIVDCKVTMEDPDSLTRIQTDYKLTVLKKDNQYIVTKIN